jgi:hypothetical protein
MKDNIEHYVHTCVKCQSSKLVHKKKFKLYKPLPIPSSPFESVWHTPKLLERFKCKFKKEKKRKKGVGVHYLAHNALGVRGACWRSKMGTKTSDKQVNYSFGPIQINQQVG